MNGEAAPEARDKSTADAFSVALMLMLFDVQVAGRFDPQLIAVVTVKLRGPKPCGGGTPGAMFTVNCHCVPLGAITPLSPRRNEKLPLAPVPGVVEQPRPTGDIEPEKPTPFNVGEVPPGTTSTAEIVPQSYGKPFGSVIVPVTVVNPPCAFTESALAAHKSVAIKMHCTHRCMVLELNISQDPDSGSSRSRGGDT